jgi:C4-dicarboxylate-specific signal transduction histidine kinase
MNRGKWIQSQFGLGALLAVSTGLCSGYALDASATAFSRDYQTENHHKGLSANEIQARTVDGGWKSAGVSFLAELPLQAYPFLWFTAVGALLAFAGLYGGFVWNVRHQKVKQHELQHAHDLLETEVKKLKADRDQAQASLETEVQEHQRADEEVQRVHKRLIEASRQAGMAEVAADVLHNVGNVLNSVNVSTTLLAEKVHRSKVSSVARVADLVNNHAGSLAAFFTEHEQGQQLPHYLSLLAEGLGREQQEMQKELETLRFNVDHIKEIVAMQQTYACIAGSTETVAVRELVEDALKMHSGAYLRHTVTVVREYDETPPITVDKHRVLQVLVNLFHNAKYACDESERADKQVIVRIKHDGTQMIRIEVADNGVGIAPENLARVFTHGFTTRKGGHGFGLHSGALATKELGGSLTVQSDGLGKGATFVLQLPLRKSD